MYKLEFKTGVIEINELIGKYCFPDKFMEFCKVCPEYNKVWSCPPLDINPPEYLREYDYAVVMGTKIKYAPDFIEKSKGDIEVAKTTVYDISVKVRNALLHTEGRRQNIKAIAPGSCNICRPCQRAFAKRCKYPEKMRYSFDSFGVDLTEIAENLLGTKLLWVKDGLPEYHMLISAFLIKENEKAADISAALVSEFIEFVKS